MQNHERQTYAERCPFPFPRTRRLDRAAVHLHDVPDDGEAQTQSSRPSRRARLGLPKALEHVRKKVRPDPDAGIAHEDLDVRVHAFDAYLHPPVLGREFDGVRDEIPDDLLQSTWIAGD